MSSEFCGLWSWRRRVTAAAITATACLAALPAWGQLPGFGDFGGFGNLDPGNEVKIQAEFTPATGDRPALLFVTADVIPGFHVFAVDQGKLPDGGGPQTSEIKLASDASARLLGPFVALQEPHSHIDQEVWPGLEIREHEGKVTWVAPIAFADGVEPEAAQISGTFVGQACDPSTCIPKKLPFTAKAGVGVPLADDVLAQAVAAAAATPAEVVPPATRDAEAPEASQGAAEAASDAAWQNVERSAPAAEGAGQGAGGAAYDIGKIELAAPQGSLLYYLITAFIGGIILNVMPCVLPVIGLKIMSFVQQAGESRRHALALNIWYSLGILAVFWALAGLAVAFGMGWGTQNANEAFALTLIGVVFAMALSLIGVWEIPIPGFVGSGAALEMAEREGRSAALLKGVLTTLLATPCTGPFMATALAWAVRQPAWVTFSVFTSLGLGMAAPYLLIGAFPSLIRFLPKPGMWMETFKKIMGLVLMATVVWLLSFLEPSLLVPTAAFLVALAGICAWMARTPLTAPFPQRAYSYATAAIATFIAVQLCYGYFHPRVMKPRDEQRLEAFARQRSAADIERIAELLREVRGPEQLAQVVQGLESGALLGREEAWQPFTLEQLARYAVQEGRTVLVDFTADWCATCKSLEAAVLKTEEVENALAAAEVVTMVADYTDAPDWMTATLGALGSNGVPVIAIFPAHEPYRPIVFSGGYTKAGLLEAIAKATGPSRVATAPRGPAR